MITVTIFINGSPVYTRSAVNVGSSGCKVKGLKDLEDYKVDDGSVIQHARSHGAVTLAHLMLDTIKEI